MTAATVTDTALGTAAAEPRVDGPVLDHRYRLGTELGHDEVSVVRRAVDDRLGRTVRVRLFDPAATELADVVTALGHLPAAVHPGLATLFDAGVTGRGCVYLVTEDVAATEIADDLDDGALPTAEVAAIGAEVAEALAALHGAGYVHGGVDLTAVVRLDADDAALLGRRTKLLNAGVHRLVGAGEYASPEQVHGRSAGAPADVYSLGLVLVALLTGRPGRLRAVGATQLDPAWDSLLGRMLATDPGDRPTALQVAAELAARRRGAA